MDNNLKLDSKVKWTDVADLVPTNKWVQIPEWFAGTWRATKVTQTYNHTYFSGEPEKLDTKPQETEPDHGDKVRGQQRDSTGNIWCYCDTPNSSRTSSTVCLNLSREFSQSTKELLLISEFMQVIMLDPKSQTLSWVEQDEILETARPTGDGGVEIISSRRGFDGQGTAMLDSVDTTVYQRIKPFEDVNEKDGQNLKQLFCDFLRNSGRSALVPVSTNTHATTLLPQTTRTADIPHAVDSGPPNLARSYYDKLLTLSFNDLCDAYDNSSFGSRERSIIQQVLYVKMPKTSTSELLAVETQRVPMDGVYAFVYTYLIRARQVNPVEKISTLQLIASLEQETPGQSWFTVLFNELLKRTSKISNDELENYLEKLPPLSRTRIPLIREAQQRGLKTP